MARPEEVRREGWKAKRLVRIPPPPPIRKTYAEATAAAAASASADEMARDLGGGGSKRRYEEDRSGARYYSETLTGGGVGKRICAGNWSCGIECFGKGNHSSLGV